MSLREKIRDFVIDIAYLPVRLGVMRLPRKGWTVLHLKRELKKNNQKTPVNKIAFLLAQSYDLEHVENILRYLPQGLFDIVVCYYRNPFVRARRNPLWLQVDKIKSVISEFDPSCCVRTFDDVVESRERYSVLVTVHSNITHTGRYRGMSGVQLIANRVMFGAFSFNSVFGIDLFWMKFFEKVFCINSMQESFLKRVPIKARVLDYGSPRFDGGVELSTKLDRKSLDSKRKTILLLSTHGKTKRDLCTLLAMMQRFTADYNVVVGYYVFSLEEKESMEDALHCKAPGVSLIIGEESVKLMPFADFVFCDYSAGTIITVIKMDKNVVVIKDRKDPSWMNDEYAAMLEPVRNKIGSFSVNEYEKIALILKNDAVWEQQRFVRAELRKQYFSVHEEPSGKLIADELLRDLKAAIDYRLD